MRRVALVLTFSALVAAAGCGGRSQAESPTAPKGPDPVAITVANVAVRRVERAVSVVGTLAANAQAELASEVDGQVVRIDADLGDRVTQGQVLARIRRDEIEARLREAEASFAKATADEARAQPLRVAGVISVQEYEVVRTALDVSRARRDQLRIQLDHADIRSPLDGSVAARRVDVGDYARAGTVLFRLVQDDPLKFRGEVPEREVPSLKAGQEVRVTVDPFPGETFLGQVTRIGSAADPTARALTFEAAVPNADHRLRPGFFGHADIVVGSDDRAVTVPRNAVTSFAGVTKVFVVEEGIAREREVALGVDLGDGWVELTQGVGQGKQVATSGLSKLADGTSVVVRLDVPPGA